MPKVFLRDGYSKIFLMLMIMQRAKVFIMNFLDAKILFTAYVSVVKTVALLYSHNRLLTHLSGADAERL